MTFLFDHDTIMDIHDYNIAKDAEEKGIRAMVSTLQELSVDREIVTQKLAAKFGLLPQAAEEKVAQYWLQ